MLKIFALISIFYSLNTFASTNGGGLLLRTMAYSPTVESLGGSGGGGVLLGSGGGGGVLASVMSSTHGGGVLNSQPKILVYFQGEKNGWTSFAYAQAQGQAWDVKQISLPSAQLMEARSLSDSLEQSRAIQNWVPANGVNE